MLLIAVISRLPREHGQIGKTQKPSSLARRFPLLPVFPSR